MLEPITRDAALIKNLYDLIYIAAVIVFILVEGLLIYSAAKFRRKAAGEMPVQVHGNTNAELLWTILPAIVVAGIFLASVNTMTQLTAMGSSSDPVPHNHAIGDKVTERRVKNSAPVDMVIEVTGRQWFWQYKYVYKGKELSVDSLIGGDKDGVLHLPADTNIRLDMTAADVIHEWYVPQLGPGLYVNPGERSYVWINAMKPGELIHGQCNYFCGLNHAQMLSKITVMPAADFEKWFEERTAATAAAEGPLQAGDIGRGLQTFKTGPCITCHTIEGISAGKVAPRPLTHFSTYPTIAQVDGFTNNPDNLAKWLKDPQSIKSGTAMPNNGLKPQQIADLVAYLSSLK